MLGFLWLQAATDAAGAFLPSPSFPDASPDKELCVCFVLLVHCQPHQTFDNNDYFKSGVDEGLDHTAPIYVCCALLFELVQAAESPAGFPPPPGLPEVSPAMAAEELRFSNWSFSSPVIFL